MTHAFLFTYFTNVNTTFSAEFLCFDVTWLVRNTRYITVGVFFGLLAISWADEKKSVSKVVIYSQHITCSVHEIPILLSSQ